jgi:protease-4
MSTHLNSAADDPPRQPSYSANPTAGGVPGPPTKIVLEQPGGWFGRWGRFLGFLLLISILGNIGQRIAYRDYFVGGDNVQERYHSLSKTAADKVAIIRVEGAILEGDGFVKRQIDQVAEDDRVKAVVLRVDSPGGTVTASDYIYHHLRQLVRKRNLPLVVSMGSLCASGGYYVAMAVGDENDAVFAEPTTWTGSIGVIIPHYDISGLLESWHIRDDSIASHPLKQLGSPTRILTDSERAEERKILQSMVDDTFSRFKEIVRSGRPALREQEQAVAQVATGQVFTASQALAHGLIDRIGFLEDAIERAIELADLDKDNVRVVKYLQHVPGVLEVLGGTEASRRSLGLESVARLIDLTAPRAWYLFTTIPPLLTNTR